MTNNYKACDCNDCRNDVNNTHGGGGIALANSSAMNMTGGYVTGNYSGLAGGGIYAGFFGHNVGFTMSGGTIAGNCAESWRGRRSSYRRRHQRRDSGNEQGIHYQ